ncbi:hypothetical protein BU24DRAFT_427525 [Aaosphaeria arxii CBS 175.79]|uniref:Oxidase ustYa n=1 Tax=Aaosphaeria arxii CBS 175.79 TaxID=1450172 RepID=A0A6A5XC64_9PLEO|nr:uncharacterized protein BU24DRAFT_427525 [Aaosphaeria arxii CBS 175.79]KAF2010397.1 hypothetical protein BU24DRAFT_427525 [Aaosphaeria arxii CBS 175.79]
MWPFNSKFDGSNQTPYYQAVAAEERDSLSKDYESSSEESEPSSQQSGGLRSIRTLLCILTALTSLLFASVVIDQVSRAELQKTPVACTPASKPIQLKDPVGLVPEVTETFQAHEDFMKPFTGEKDAWSKLLPPGRGFVFVPEPREYGLNEGQETPWGEIFSVSLFHQIHCLGLLRKQYWTLLNHVASGDQEAALKESLKQQENTHTGHCFDYLRQALMCAGDMSMEWPRDEPDGSKRRHVDGWDIPHKCKSWDTIWQYMMTNAYNASKYDDISI